jgi:hypothetical protein
MMQHIPLSSRLTLDVSGAAAALATFMGYLPGVLGAVASLAAIVWYTVQVYYFFKDRK